METMVFTISYFQVWLLIFQLKLYFCLVTLFATWQNQSSSSLKISLWLQSRMELGSLEANTKLKTFLMPQAGLAQLSSAMLAQLSFNSLRE